MGLFASDFFSNPLLITVQLQIEEISRKLRTGDLGISHNLEERFERHSFDEDLTLVPANTTNSHRNNQTFFDSQINLILFFLNF
jgi:hypothetical protein